MIISKTHYKQQIINTLTNYLFKIKLCFKKMQNFSIDKRKNCIFADRIKTELKNEIKI